jgi:hypothetical protein
MDGAMVQNNCCEPNKKNHLLGGFYKALDHVLSKKNYMSSYKVTRILPHEGHGLFIGLKFNVMCQFLMV